MMAGHSALPFKRWIAGTLLPMALAGPHSAEAAGQLPTQPDTTIVATLRVELLPFDDSVESVRRLELVGRSVPPIRGELPVGGTISSLILQEFGLGVSDLRLTYSAIERLVLELNGLTQAERAMPGPILLPGLPRRVRPETRPDVNPFPAVAEMRIVPFGVDRIQAATIAGELGAERTATVSRPRATSVSFDVQLTASLLADDKIAALSMEPFTSHPQATLTVKFEQGACDNPNPAPTLTPEQRAQLASTLATATRVVPVYIIDTGWPSSDGRLQSVQHLRSLMNDIRQHYRLNPLPTTPLGSFVEPTIPHCKNIHTSLAEFRAIDDAHIQTVYVPMSKEQGAGTLLKDMIELSEIVTRVTARFGNNPPPTIPSDIVSQAQAFATRVVDALPAQISGLITETDKAIVDAVIGLAAEGARLRRTYHVVNESWVVQRNVVPLKDQGNLMGVVVAATGNDDRNVTLEEVDFARRSSPAGFYVAVMNVNAEGDPVCRSSKIDLGVVDIANALGFPGAIPGRSGTSYASPRIAWLLAAAEAVRPIEVAPGIWGGRFVERLRQARRIQKPTSIRDLLADPVKLVRLWLN